MIICTNCNHENPEGSVQCENCYAPLPKTSPCPNCGAFTQINAAFCGQCGYNLLSEEPLAFIDQDYESEDLSESKATIPHQNIDYTFEKPWETRAEESSESGVSDLEIDETEFIAADSSEELEIEGPDLDLAPEISEEPGAIADEVLEPEEPSFDLNSENDTFEADLEHDVEQELEAELPELSDIDQLEATTAMSESELTPLDELEIESPAVDLAAEIPEDSGTIADEIVEDEVVELEEPEKLEEVSLELKSENDTLEPNLEQELETKLPALSEIDELVGTTTKSISELLTVEELGVGHSELDLAAETEELGVEHSELDLAAETAEPSLLEKLESLEIDELPSKPVQETAMPAQEQVQVQEIESPDVASKMPESAEPAIAKSSAMPSPRSWAKPLHPVSESATQLQLERIILFHVQTNTDIELAQNLDIIHIGKPNNQVPPDIDVSGFPDANIVSRVHANIRAEGNIYFIEDAGSSNGTYINHKPLDTGNRHRLRFGDRISLGKGDLMTFIFKIIDD